MTVRNVGSVLLLSLVLFSGAVALHRGRAQLHDACAAESRDGAYETHVGPLQTTQEDIVLHDSGRDKDLPVRVTCPREGGPYPVIVFSHGAGGSGEDYGQLAGFWARHGYVCLQPTHADSIVLRRKMGERVNARDVLRDTVRADLRGWEDRPADVSFLLDSLDEVVELLPAVAGKMDTTAIGVGGHSFGAHTCQMLGGALAYLPGRGKPVDLSDPRVKAVLLISPQGRSEPGLIEDSWDNCVLPTLTITGSKDRGRDGQSPEWRMEPFSYSPPGGKFLAYIQGADHGFGGIGTPRPAQDVTSRQYRQCVQMASLALFDAYLKADTRAQDWLRSDGLERFSKGIATLRSK